MVSMVLLASAVVLMVVGVAVWLLHLNTSAYPEPDGPVFDPLETKDGCY